MGVGDAPGGKSLKRQKGVERKKALTGRDSHGLSVRVRNLARAALREGRVFTRAVRNVAGVHFRRASRFF